MNMNKQTMCDGELRSYDVTCLASEWWDRYHDLVDHGIAYCIGDGTAFSYQGYMLSMGDGTYKIFGSDRKPHTVFGNEIIYIKFGDLAKLESQLAYIKSVMEKEQA